MGSCSFKCETCSGFAMEINHVVIYVTANPKGL